jgi:anti-sigma factor RsiW
MTDAEKPVSAEDLHAYADAQLSDEDAARIAIWLQAHPDDDAKVRQWQAQNRAIQAMFAPYRRSLPGDTELLNAPSLPPKQPSFRRSALVAAGVCLFIAGVATGHYLPRAQAPQVPGEAASLHDEASSAFLIYTSEMRHPVEVRANEKDHLVTWLGKRLGHKFAAPDLSGLGFSLVGGRLVPVNGKAGALLMYEDALGNRLTVMVGQSAEKAVTSFRFASAGPVETFYWIDDNLSYAVTGEIPRDMLRRIAEVCYQQFDS